MTDQDLVTRSSSNALMANVFIGQERAMVINIVRMVVTKIIVIQQVGFHSFDKISFIVCTGTSHLVHKQVVLRTNKSSCARILKYD